MPDAEKAMIETEWKTDHGTYPVYSKDDARALRRAAIDRAWGRPHPVMRVGLLATQGEHHGQDMLALLCRPVTRKKRPFREFAQWVTYHGLWEHGKKFILCAEALDVRPQSSPLGSWVLRLVHRAYHDQHLTRYSELNELLMRVDAEPLESFIQHPPGPVQLRRDEVADEAKGTLTTIGDVTDMIQHVDYGELHLGHLMQPDPLQPGGHTLRPVRAPPARFHGLFARGILHKTVDWKDALIQAHGATGQG